MMIRFKTITMRTKKMFSDPKMPVESYSSIRKMTQGSFQEQEARSHHIRKFFTNENKSEDYYDAVSSQG